ncbi:unnamed protein product [Protopolystoma xenopodis]|uniref:Uncharacterized protein n=1 Tax=Protopolystoma xenopodis TaxID=117903 RepID=A0A448X905_9PLAT|nr:unnamed protein product [Protopolystoma xenopodis]
MREYSITNLDHFGIDVVIQFDTLLVLAHLCTFYRLTEHSSLPKASAVDKTIRSLQSRQSIGNRVTTGPT